MAMSEKLKRKLAGKTEEIEQQGANWEYNELLWPVGEAQMTYPGDQPGTHSHMAGEKDVLAACERLYTVLTDYLEGKGMEKAAPALYGYLYDYIKELQGKVRQ